MAQPQPEMTFGRYLRLIRENRGISIPEVSELTKIPVHILRDLESEVLSRLPETVFIKGFIRAHAEAVGADPVEALRLYAQAGTVPVATVKPKMESPKSRTTFWRPLILALIAFAGIIVISVWVMSERQAIRLEKETISTSGAFGKKEETVLESTKPKDDSANERTDAQEVPPEGYLLDLKATGDTWVRVAIDHHDPKEYILKKGDHLALKAADGLQLQVQDPDGVVMKLNGKPLVVEGERGKPIKLNIP